MVQALLALIAAALFTGAAVYISIAEHPARLGLADSAALAQWQPSYKAAVPLQAGLALLGGAFGLWSWFDRGDPLLLVGAILIFSVVPFTLLVIMPVNKRLQAIAPEQASADTRAMLMKWGGLHWVRNLAGVAAVVVFAFAIAT